MIIGSNQYKQLTQQEFKIPHQLQKKPKYVNVPMRPHTNKTSRTEMSIR